jgi:hypothetical protein
LRERRRGRRGNQCCQGRAHDGFDLLLGRKDHLLGRVEVALNLNAQIVHPPGQAIVERWQVVSETSQ